MESSISILMYGIFLKTVGMTPSNTKKILERDKSQFSVQFFFRHSTLQTGMPANVLSALRVSFKPTAESRFDLAKNPSNVEPTAE